jgi:hypothetical protein
VRRLSGEQLRLPIAETLNHAMLLELVRRQWRPEHEGREGS